MNTKKRLEPVQSWDADRGVWVERLVEIEVAPLPSARPEPELGAGRYPPIPVVGAQRA